MAIANRPNHEYQSIINSSRLAVKNDDFSDLLSIGIARKKVRNGTVVRALASHQCGPGSIPGVDAKCGLSLLLVLAQCPNDFSPGSLVLQSTLKNIQIRLLRANLQLKP